MMLCTKRALWLAIMMIYSVYSFGIESMSHLRGKKSGISINESLVEQIDSTNFPDMIKSFDYPNADIKDIIDAIGHLTGINFIIDPNVKGTISIIAPTPITVAEAFQAFLSSLSMHGYALVQSGAFWKIIPTAKAASDKVKIYKGSSFPVIDQYITKVFRLRHASVSSLEKHLKLFLTNQTGSSRSKSLSKVVISEETNSMIITDYGSAIEKISEIIKILDVPSQHNLVEVISVQHAEATDLASKIVVLLFNQGSRRSSSRLRRSTSNLVGSRGSHLGISAIVPDERTNTIVVSGSKQGVRKVKKLISQLDFYIDPQTAGGIYVYYVKHGVAKDLEGTLNKILNPSSKGKSKSSIRSIQMRNIFNYSGLRDAVSLTSDSNTNSLLVTASKKDYTILKSILSRIDIPKNQVFIKTIIMDFDAENKLDWDITLYRLFDSQNSPLIPRIGFSNKSIADVLNPANSSNLILGGGSTISIPAQALSLMTGGVGLGEDSKKSGFSIPSLLSLVKLLKTKAGGNIISTPQIVAIDNEPSSITVGVNAPVNRSTSVSTSGGFANTSIERKDIETKMEITPYINPDGKSVRLKIAQKIDSIGQAVSFGKGTANAADAFSVTKREIKTNVILNDGSTAILGGLIDNKEVVKTTKIPILGDLPIIGWLFKSSLISKKRKNLIVFITPTIIKTPSEHESLVRDVVDERIDFIKKFTGQNSEQDYKILAPSYTPLSASSAQ